MPLLPDQKYMSPHIVRPPPPQSVSQSVSQSVCCRSRASGRYNCGNLSSSNPAACQLGPNRAARGCSTNVIVWIAHITFIILQYLGHLGTDPIVWSHADTHKPFVCNGGTGSCLTVCGPDEAEQCRHAGLTWPSAASPLSAHKVSTHLSDTPGGKRWEQSGWRVFGNQTRKTEGTGERHTHTHTHTHRGLSHPFALFPLG